MSASERIETADIEISKPLPWPLFDSGGVLVLEQGSLIASQQQLTKLIKRGLFRTSATIPTTASIPHAAPNSPFEQINALTERLHQILCGIQQSDPRSEQYVIELATQIQALCKHDADALIGAIHLYQDVDYVSNHPVHVAILAEIFSAQLAIDSEHRLHIICAALTANTAILDLQTHLHNQLSELSAAQQVAIRQHPEQGVAMLRRTGISNPIWLNAVLQHHERIDGRGYPGGIRGEEIDLPAKIIALSDIYSAMVVSKGYRTAHPVNNVLRIIFIKKGKEYDEVLCLNMIKMLGIFPPGSFVKLNNGETAVVTHRCHNNTMHPKVASLLSVAGAPYTQPIHRDTQKEAFRIRDMCTLNRRMPLDLRAIWNYQ